MSLLCGILSKRGFGVATKETSYNGAIIEVTWQLYQRTVVVKVNKSLRTTVRRLRRRRHRHTLGHSPEKLAESNCFSYVPESFYNVNYRVFLQRQLWIINYYIKTSPNDLSNENRHSGVSREIIFQK